MHNHSKCFHCGSVTKVKVRDISIESWETLFQLGEVTRSEINMPVCDTCANELRDVMIDRRNEVSQLQSASRGKQRVAS